MEKLKEWTIQFIKQKDILQKSIVELKANHVIHVKTKDKEQVYIVMPSIDGFQEAIEYAEKGLWVGVVCYNTRHNLELLIKNWQTLIKYPKLCMFFVNPESSLDKKWIIYPATHNKICDPKNLKQGLESMFVMVEEYH